jgi:PAS domain S-box-containing protein
MRRTADSRMAQAQAQRMSNYYAAVSRTNQAIGRMADPVALYEAVCAICVDAAQARLACVFVAEGHMARRVAAAGPVARLFEALPNPWDMTTPDGSASFAARCLRTGQRVICDDIQKTPPVATWLQRDLAHGFHAMAFLPVRRGGLTVATLMIASGEPGIFDAPLVRLLDEMTSDISNALDHFDREAERLESARQVKAGLDRFTRLFEAAPMPAAIISIDDRCLLDVNDAMCELHRATRDELIGRSTESLAHRAVDEDRGRFYETLARDGRVRNLVLRMADPQRGPRAELMNAEPIDYLGRPCVIFISLDISEMQAAEKARDALMEVQAASHAKTQFLSSMSHELRTPLNAVLGFSSLLRHQAADRLTPQQLEQLDHIQQAGWHLLRLINDVLDVSRIEAGQLGIELRGVELAPLIDEAIQMSQPLATRARVTLRAHYRDAAPAWVLADATRLRQVVLNLLSNATKYNREDGAVDISLTRRDGHVEIEVADTGLGMDAGQLAHLFEPFNRLGRERQGFEGTGIGLALARQLMLLMNGQVHVSSEPGRGTRVALTLPDAIGLPPLSAVVAPSSTPVAADGTPPCGTVLYIEDNAVNSLLVEHLLARWSGVQFVGAVDGSTGLQAAIALRPDLVLLDMQLPDLDGMLVLKRLREHPDLRDTPVIVLSANAMPEEIARARAHGAADYWTKPLDFQRFLAGVARMLAARRKTDFA